MACALASACGDDGAPDSGEADGSSGEAGSGGARAGNAGRGGAGRGGSGAEAGGSVQAGSSGSPGASGEIGDAGDSGDGGLGAGGDAASGGAAGRGGSDSGGDGPAGHGGDGPSAIFCGNGAIDDGEECERRVGCDPTERCTATCTCEPGPEYTPSSQGLIERAYEAGTIDYPTSLLYRTWALFHAPELPAEYDGAGSIGEDTFLFLELSRVQGSLPAEIEAQIAPYVVRPDDPSSIFSQPIPAAARITTLPAPAASTSVGCQPNANGLPDWRSYETERFVVWSCGGGVNGTDPLAGARVVTGTMAEAAMTAMEPKLGGVMPDNYPATPSVDGRTDIYLLTPNQCRERNGFCTPVPNKTLAAAAPAKPCGAPGGGPVRSSAYLVVGSHHVPASVPAADSPSPFRALLVHELFHAISFRLNLGAQGGVCRGPQEPALPTDSMRSWLTEASAEWASYAFAQNAWPERRSRLFFDFTINRYLAHQGLHEATDLLPYQAYLYPLFVQEQSGASPQAMYDFWVGSGSARNRVDLDNRLNTVFSFSENFREFSVRNFNHDLPGTPIPFFHGSYDEAIALDDPHAVISEPAPELPAPLAFSEPIKLAPLSTDIVGYKLTDSTRYFRIDAREVSNVGHLHLDALVKIGETWERRRIDGPLFQFCREHDGQDISEIYLFLSNFDHNRAGRIDGTLKLKTSTSCPGGWSGFMRVRQTFTDYYARSDMFSSEVKNTLNLETQEWIVTESEEYEVHPGAPPIDRARVTFRGETTMHTEIVATSNDCTETTLNVESGSGTHQELFNFSSFEGGVLSFTPIEQYPGFDADNLYTVETCEGSQSDWSIHPHPNMFAYLGLAPIVEDPNDPGHFVGTAHPIHEVTEEPGQLTILDIEVEWDLRRTLTDE
jgi:hypothetical protein